MGFRGGVKLTPPQHILVFKYPSRDRVKPWNFFKTDEIILKPMELLGEPGIRPKPRDLSETLKFV